MTSMKVCLGIVDQYKEYQAGFVGSSDRSEGPTDQRDMLAKSLYMEARL